jgi:hypothetical protein
MVKAFVNDIAHQMGLKLSDIQMVEGDRIGCNDANLLHMFSDGHMVSAVIYLTEYVEVIAGLPCEPLELRVMSAMSRLKMMLEP